MWDWLTLFLREQMLWMKYMRSVKPHVLLLDHSTRYFSGITATWFLMFHSFIISLTFLYFCYCFYLVTSYFLHQAWSVLSKYVCIVVIIMMMIWNPWSRWSLPEERILLPFISFYFNKKPPKTQFSDPCIIWMQITMPPFTWTFSLFCFRCSRDYRPQAQWE